MKLKAMSNRRFKKTLNALYDKEKFFYCGFEMLMCVVDEGHDLYNPQTGLYISLYNNQASIAVYHLSREDVDNLIEKQKAFNESWSENLGSGGNIYDDRMYTNGDGPYALEGDNAEWCNEHYRDGKFLFGGDWYFVEKIIVNEEREKKENGN